MWRPNTNNFRWHTNRDGIVGNIVLNERMRAYNGPLTDTHTVKHRYTGTKPCMGTYSYATFYIHRSRDKRLVSGPLRVVARANVAIGPHQNTFTDLDPGISGHTAIRADIATWLEGNRPMFRRNGSEPPNTDPISYVDTTTRSPNVERCIVIYQNASTERYLTRYT
jgi:hypothetical protein